MRKIFCVLVALFPVCIFAQGVWTADLGNGEYKNPVLYADYSDPDVIRTGEDYWMTASSFNCVPGLQILHSTDLVNWEIVSAALPRLYDEAFDWASHGNGVWAPAIRFHNGWYYIYWGDPDRGIYMIRAEDPRSKWSEPLLVKPGKGLIDPCPLWDDDGKAYLVHGWAGSRAGFKSVLSICEMSPEGDAVTGGDVLIFDGHDANPTVEGPKFYKRNGWYYVFAPAGGVKTGWQLVLRSRSPYGPYECRKVLHQGDTQTPGPHQGAWVEDVAGDSWFLHFVDMHAYGRVAHLQPMTWSDDDWCVIGVDRNHDGVGEPVDSYRMPASRIKSAVRTPAVSDEFSSHRLGLQWQWHGNPQTGWYFTDPSVGRLRLMCLVHNDMRWNIYDNMWNTPALLLQKIAAPDCTYTTKVSFRGAYDGDRAGLIVMGLDYATLGIELRDGRLWLEQGYCLNADKGSSECVNDAVLLDGGSVWLRCRIERQTASNGIPRMLCTFSYSLDGKRFAPLGKPFTAREGRWIGAKIGYYATAEIKKNDGGWLDIDWFRETK
ncbi:glycoside hydrolase 43 family protein [uncultured Alistipes sp.]|uniref:glycoside hydrolase family 43 protein n=1 Tax=uncultured Alistipes sp. TaxID=538949 RepID=UPI0025F71BF1|nr:glycoside hydrolase 43 family protein [uncultured Alistipes sp.]